MGLLFPQKRRKHRKKTKHAKQRTRTITIHTYRGVVDHVSNLPKGIYYRVKDYDD